MSRVRPVWRSASKQVDGKRKIIDLKSQWLKEKQQEKYRAANKEVKRRARAYNRKNMNNVATLAKKAATRNEP